jgi:SprT-like family
MRTREREKVERHARRVAALVQPELGSTLRVLWCRRLPEGDTYHTYALADDDEPWIFVDEYVYQLSSPDEREDTIRHEIAHIIAYQRHGANIADHGPEYQRARKQLDKAIEDEHS